jgi:hypothetical protein
MRLNKTIACVTLLTQLVFGQNNTIAIRNLNPVSEEYTFPEIQTAPKTKISEKINTFLQLHYLQHLPGVFKKTPFEKVTYDSPENQGGSYLFYGWTKEDTPPNVLSLTMSTEFSGAYIEGYDTHENFDLRTGNYLLVTDIIRPEKHSLLAQQVNTMVKKEITAFLSETKKNLTEIDSISQRELFDRYQAQIELYENCLSDYTEYQLGDFDYYFTKNQLHLLRGRCSSHVNRAIDDLYQFDLPFSYTDLLPLLSDYGKNVLYDTPIKNYNSASPIGKMYKGKIGNNAVTLVLPNINYDSSLTITYWYDKYKTPIECHGTFKDNHFYLMEQSPDDFSGLIGIIEGEWENGTIKGVWINHKTKKEYPLLLILY